MYEKALKKCRKLEMMVEELRACLEPTEMPTRGGNQPLYACGTRFVSHKVAALGRLVDRFGIYPCHVAAMMEDRSIRSTDRRKLNGYLLKSQDAKFLRGCAFFSDLLRKMSYVLYKQPSLCLRLSNQ